MQRDFFLQTGGSRAATIAFESCQGNQEYESQELSAHLIKNILQTLLSECRALDVFDRTEFTRKAFSLFGNDRSLFLSLEFLHHLRVIT